MNNCKPLKLSLIPFVPWSVYLVASKKGFWNKNGIDVDLNIHETEESYVESMENRREDFYPLPLSSVLELSSLKDPLYCTGFFDVASGHKKIIVKNKFRNSLKGKKIVCYSDEVSTRYFLSRFLSTENLTLNDIKLIFYSGKNIYDLYASEDVAACLIFQETPDLLFEISESQIAFTTGDYTEPFTVAVPSSRYTSRLRSGMSGFIKGRAEAMSWINSKENELEFVNLVLKYLFKEDNQLSKERIMELFNQLKTPSAEELLDLNTKKSSLLFETLSRSCITNNILSQQKVETFKADSILKNNSLIKFLRENYN